MCKSRLERRFIHGSSADAKFVKSERHHRPGCHGRTKGKPGGRRRQHNRQMRAKGQPGTPSAAWRETGVQGNLKTGRQKRRGLRPEGQPEGNGSPGARESCTGRPCRRNLAAPEGEGCGATRRTTGRTRPGQKDGETRPAEPGQRRRRRSEAARAIESSRKAIQRNCRKTGRGETQGPVSRRRWSVEQRGNPNLRAGAAKDAGTRETGEPSPAQPVQEGGGATRGFLRRAARDDR